MRHPSLRRALNVLLYRVWAFFFARIPNVTLYEFSESIKRLSKTQSDDAWSKIKKAFAQRFSAGPLFHHSIVLVLTPEGSKYYCPYIHSQELLKEIYHDKIYDKFFEPSEGSTVIDAGAHVGSYTLKAARKVGKKGTVVSVEPDPQTYSLLLTNVKMNGFELVVIPVNIALANFVGKTKLYINPKDHCGNTIVPFGQEWTEVSVNTIDGLMKKLGLKYCDLLKIDVEGYELEVLKGAQTTLKNTSKVVVAAYHEWAFKGEEKAIEDYLKSSGFSKVFSNSSMVYAIK